MSLYSTEDFLAVIHEFLSPDENNRILADQLFSLMYQHNQQTSHNDDINISLLTSQLGKIPDIEQFVHGVLHYLHHKILQQSILGMGHQNFHDRYPIVVTAQYPNAPLNGMATWVKIIAPYFPSTLSLFTQYIQHEGRDFFAGIVMNIRQNNHNDDLFIPMIEDAFLSLLEMPILFANIIDDSEKLQSLAWHKIQYHHDFYHYYITPFLYLKSPSTKLIDSLHALLIEKEKAFPESLFTHYLADLIYLSHVANYNTAHIRALLLPMLQENKIIDIPLILSLKYVIKWPEDQMLINAWMANKDPWKRLATYSCYASIPNPPLELVNTALKDIGQYSLGNDQPHAIACQAISHWHQQGITIPLDPIIKWFKSIFNGSDITDPDYKFVINFQELSPPLLPLLLERQASLDRDKNNQQSALNHCFTPTKNHHEAVDQLSDREVHDALLNLEEIKHVLTIQKQSKKLANLSLEPKVEELLTFIQSVEETLLNTQVDAAEQRQYLILIDEKMDYIQAQLDNYVDQKLYQFKPTLDHKNSNNVDYSQEDRQNFMSSLQIKERKTLHPANQSTNNVIKLIEFFQSSRLVD